MDRIPSGIRHGDCVAGMDALPAGSVDLVFADPPFNIGYKYDVYDDRQERTGYLDWSREWIAAAYRVLKPDGTFWLAIGDEYAAELKLASQGLGFYCRSWVIWYYTFGVNCSAKFTRSHAHLFHFVKDPAQFTFRSDDLDNRIPSARELVYNDRRAKSTGRLPDDTWIIPPADMAGELGVDDGIWVPADINPAGDTSQTFVIRPQDLADGFSAEEDTWYFPRVAGTFKERAGFHGCQMPEQLLGRIIRVCTEPGELVLDPFSGSATTAAVAKKLGREYVAFDLSSDYIRYGNERLAGIQQGDRLNGSAEPLKSAPATARPHGKQSRPKAGGVAAAASARSTPASVAVEQRYQQFQQELTERGVQAAFEWAAQGFSVDRLIADPALNEQFLEHCRQLSLVGHPRLWNTLLLRLRKRGQLISATPPRRTEIGWAECEPFLHASEIALQRLLIDGVAESLDEVLCDPDLASQFDVLARQLAPGHTSLEYRWGALRLRKATHTAIGRAATLMAGRKSPVASRQLSSPSAIGDLDVDSVVATSGLYVVTLAKGAATGGRGRKREAIYVGAAGNLQTRFRCQFGRHSAAIWESAGPDVQVQAIPLDFANNGPLAWQACLIHQFRGTRWNLRDLQPAKR